MVAVSGRAKSHPPKTDDGRTGANRVIRGGSWGNNAQNCRVSYRNNNSPDNRNDNLGFRLLST